MNLDANITTGMMTAVTRNTKFTSITTSPTASPSCHAAQMRANSSSLDGPGRAMTNVAHDHFCAEFAVASKHTRVDQSSALFRIEVTGGLLRCVASANELPHV